MDESIVMSIEAAFRPVLRQRLSDALVERILLCIGDRQLLVGDRLPTIAEMARRFRVARATVREALVTLELMCVVEIRHGAGVYVKRRPSDHRAA